MPATDLKNRLIEAATRAGAQKTGFAKAGPVDDDMTERFGQWLEAGNHGEMHYMANHADLRRDPRLLSENTAGANTVMKHRLPEPQGSPCMHMATITMRCCAKGSPLLPNCCTRKGLHAASA